MSWGWFLFGLLVGNHIGQSEAKYQMQLYQCPYCGRQSYLVFGPGQPKKQYTPYCPNCLTTMDYQVSFYR